MKWVFEIFSGNKQTMLMSLFVYRIWTMVITKMKLLKTTASQYNYIQKNVRNENAHNLSHHLKRTVLVNFVHLFQMFLTQHFASRAHFFLSWNRYSKRHMQLKSLSALNNYIFRKFSLQVLLISQSIFQGFTYIFYDFAVWTI